MAQLMGILSFLVSIYMVIIFVRIMLTWFTGIASGGIQDFLAKITDPYLNWFRRFPILRMGFLDLSPIVALGVLSLVQRIFSTLAIYKTITIGIILAMVLQILWGAVSFILGFLIIMLILRLIAHFARVNTYSPFWRIIDTISQPVIFRINRILFRGRIVNFGIAVIVSAASLGIMYLLLKALVVLLSGVLIRLPI